MNDNDPADLDLRLRPVGTKKPHFAAPENI
jgi:hypothetical protein